MIRLSLLPGVELTGADGHPVRPVLQQPKRLAVLAYLALAGPGAFRQRDSILALFWPEATADRARQALNASTHFLRQHLGAAVIVSRGAGEIGISPETGQLWCDAIAFRAAVDDDPAGALTLYRGDLLDGFFIDAGPEFDRWLDSERRRLREAATEAAHRLADAAERRGAAAEALGWARRRVELAEHDETAVQATIAMMGRLGDRAGALELYDRFATRLAQEYEGARPAPETSAIVDRIRAAHAPPPPTAVSRPGGDVRVSMGVAVSPSPGHTSAPAPRMSGRAVHSGRNGVVVVAAIGAMALSGVAFQPGRPSDVTARPERPRVAITALGAPDSTTASARVAAALTAALTDRLARVPSIEVLTPGTPGVAPGAPVAADFVVGGAVFRAPTGVRVDLQVTDAHSGAAVKTAELDASTGDDALAPVDTLAGRIGTLVRNTLGRQLRIRRLSASLGDRRLTALMQDADAEQDRADELGRSGEPRAAVRALASAAATLQRVEAAAPATVDARLTRAGVLGGMAIAYLMPGMHGEERVEPLLRESVAEAGRGVALDPRSAAAAAAFGSLGYTYWLFVPLPRDSAAVLATRAESSLRRAVRLDPQRADAWNTLSVLLLLRGDFEGAYVAAAHAYDTDTYAQHTREILSRLFVTAYEIGDDSAATRWCAETTRRLARTWDPAYCHLSLLAWTGRPDRRGIAEAWRYAAAGARASDADPSTAARLHMFVAAVLARAGLRDSAMAVARRARAGDVAGDLEIIPLEAHVRLLLGDSTGAAGLLRQYLATAPSRREGVLKSRRFVALRPALFPAAR